MVPMDVEVSRVMSSCHPFVGWPLTWRFYRLSEKASGKVSKLRTHIQCANSDPKRTEYDEDVNSWLKAAAPLNAIATWLKNADATFLQSQLQQKLTNEKVLQLALKDRKMNDKENGIVAFNKIRVQCDNFCKICFIWLNQNDTTLFSLHLFSIASHDCL